MILGLFLLSAYPNAIDIKNSGSITLEQNNVLIRAVETFCVIKGEHFLLPDRKAGDIKIFNPQGKLIKVWGRKGQGPDEFLSPMFCDYLNPNLVMMDWGKRRLMLFVEDKDTGINFKKVSEKMIMELGYGLKFIDSKKILVSGYKENPGGKEYDLYFLNLKDEKIDFILPSHEKCGYASQREYQNAFLSKIAPIGLRCYCDYSKDNIYFVWEGKLRILKIDSDSRKFSSFGEVTGNYTPSKVTPRMLKLYNERSKEQITEMQKMSFVTGIFADDGFVGLTYANYNKGADGWQTIAQVYALGGKLLLEKILPGAIDTSASSVSSFYYNKQNDTCTSFQEPWTRNSTISLKS